jgi:hypothetical protein|eukprot:COSAG01_NODE_3834_length_5650_cov_4.421005_7_plen_61_part_00
MRLNIGGCRSNASGRTASDDPVPLFLLISQYTMAARLAQTVSDMSGVHLPAPKIRPPGQQ